MSLNPGSDLSMSLGEALAARRSGREFGDRRLGTDHLDALLWAAQGRTGDGGKRTAPSAGATFPMECRVATAGGVAKYLADGSLEDGVAADIRPHLVEITGQEMIGRAAAVFAFSAVLERTSQKYGERAERYVPIEAGHIAQNVLLAAAALGINAVPVGSFEDDEVGRLLDLPPGERPVYMVAVGFPPSS